MDCACLFVYINKEKKRSITKTSKYVSDNYTIVSIMFNFNNRFQKNRKEHELKEKINGKIV